jgi:hypothetical protein
LVDKNIPNPSAFSPVLELVEPVVKSLKSELSSNLRGSLPSPNALKMTQDFYLYLTEILRSLMDIDNQDIDLLKSLCEELPDQVEN